MNITRKLVLAGLAIAAAVACQPTPSALKMESFDKADSTAHADLSMNVELPVPMKGPAGLIRTKLIEVMDAQLSHIASFGDEPRVFPAYEGNPLDTKAVMNYYWDQSLEAFGGVAQEDYDMRVASVAENDGLSEEEREFALSSMPRFEYAFSIVKTDETDRYVVFVNEDYVYLGGAHGGITGQGPLTFDKKTGDLVEQFLEPGCLKDIQPLLRKGLAEYFAVVKTKKTAAKAAKDLAAAFETALNEAVPKAVTASFKNFVSALASKGVKVVIATRADVETVQPAFAGILGENVVLYHESSATYGSVKWDAWRRACAMNKLRNFSTIAITGSGLGVKSALVAGMGSVAVVNPHVAYQDFGGADEVVRELNSAAAKTVLEILRV